MKRVLFVLLASAPGWAQTSDSTTLNITFTSGLFSIRNVGSAAHEFSPITFESTLSGTTLPLQLRSSPTFLVTNIGNPTGWSVTLSETHNFTTDLQLDYQPGAGHVGRLSGLELPGDLTHDQDLGGSLRSGRKVLSAPARTNQGFFLYTPAASRWTLSFPSQQSASGRFNWTLQATLSANP